MFCLPRLQIFVFFFLKIKSAVKKTKKQHLETLTALRLCRITVFESVSDFIQSCCRD